MSKTEQKKKGGMDGNVQLFTSSAPWPIPQFVWVFKVVDRYVGKKISSTLLRAISYVVIVSVIGFSIFWFLNRDIGHFQYQTTSIGWGSGGPSSHSESIGIQFKANVQNISGSPRYLKNFIVVLWNDKSSGNPWLYSLPSEYGEMSLIEGATTVPITLPLKFDANEEKILAWSFSINTSEEITHWYRDLLTEEKCINPSGACEKTCAVVNRNNNSLGQIRFFDVIKVVNTPNSSTTPNVPSPECTKDRNELAILMVDTRGNVFDESGKLQSLDVMYNWWTFSNNRTILQKFVGAIKIYSQILYWEVNAIIPNPK